VGELHAVAEGQVLQVVRQLHLRGHLRALHQHRDHRDVAPQRRRRLQPHEITGIVQPAPAVGPLEVKPLPAHQCQQHRAARHLGVDGLAEVDPRLDAHHVHEDRVGAKHLAQVLEQAARMALGILATVADEDRTHGRLLGRARRPHQSCRQR
jgi:hypothetical protein